MASQHLPMMAGPQSTLCILTDGHAAALTSHSAVGRAAGQLRRQTAPGPLQLPCAEGNVCAVRHCHATAASPLCCQCLASPVAGFCCNSSLWQGHQRQRRRRPWWPAQLGCLSEQRWRVWRLHLWPPAAGLHRQYPQRELCPGSPAQLEVGPAAPKLRSWRRSEP